MDIHGVKASNIRFTWSSLHEVMRSAEVLLMPRHHVEQMPWIRVARRRLAKDLRKELEHFQPLFTPQVETFGLEDYRDAVLLRLSGRRTITRAEMTALRPAKAMRAIGAAFTRENPAFKPFVTEFLKSPALSESRFTRFLEQYQRCIIEPLWGDLSEELSSDIAMRQNVLANHGVVAALRTLGLTVEGDEEAATLRFGDDDRPYTLRRSDVVECTPSFFLWPHKHFMILKRPGGVTVTVAYPVEPLPRRPSSVDAAQVNRMKALSDPLRLRLVSLLSKRELSTRELAAFLDTSEGVVSRHLQILRRAELLEVKRDGYFVLYRLRRRAFQQLETLIRSWAGPG